MRKAITFLSIILVFFVLTCNQDEKACATDTSTINPNGDSELALLMREMFDDAMRMKLEYREGKQPEVLKKFASIHTAQATEPEKAASAAYKGYADTYLAAIESLKNANEDEFPLAFQSMVDVCMNCHKAMCPGPMVRIKKLNLPELKQ